MPASLATGSGRRFGRMVDPAEVREYWTRAASRWREYGGFVREMTAPVSRAMVEAAGPAPGETWLDVASGIGDPASRVALSVGREGHVVMSDLIPGMIRGARALVEGSRVSTIVAAAEAIPARGVFHGVTCRFGAMFFTDPPSALAEIRTALLPGGRAAFAVWKGPDRNPFFREIDLSIRRIAPETPEPDPDDPHVFRYAPRDKLASIMRASGWDEVEETSLPFQMIAPIAHSRFWDHVTGLSVSLSGLIEEMSPDQRVTLRAEVERRVEPYFDGDRMRMPAEVRLLTARSPSTSRGAVITPPRGGARRRS